MNATSMLRFLPKNLLSHLFGRLARCRFTEPLQVEILELFVKLTGVDREEIDKPLTSYKSLLDFFVRDLKPGLRPIGQGLVSPVDGKLVNFGAISERLLLQAKGKKYKLSQFLPDESLVERFLGGSFLTIYLAPYNYHWVHAPLDGQVEKMIHVPGKLWPVNEGSLNSVKDLFAVNERVHTLINTSEGLLCVSMVGAMNVGSMEVVYDQIHTNRVCFSKRLLDSRTYGQGMKLEKGDKLGVFRLGSTVILLFENSLGSNLSVEPGKSVRMGQSLVSVGLNPDVHPGSDSLPR